jgi:CheY-like chemotaxis protein
VRRPSDIASVRPAVEQSRILVIDDDGPTRELLSDVLTRDGHAVVTESSGVRGRALAIAESFDLILSDIDLPDLNGIRLVQELRAAGVTIPVIALSGHTDEVDRQKGRAAGFDDYLFKPIKAGLLRAEVARRAGGAYPAVPAAEPASDPWIVSPSLASGAAVDPSVRAKALETPVPQSLPRPRRRGVLGGLVVVAMGIPFLLQALGVPNAASYLFLAMGGAFLMAYGRARQYVYLIPTVTLGSFGVGLLLPTWFVMRPDVTAPAFVGSVAIGFFVAFGVAPRKRWPLVPAVLLGGLAMTRLVTGSSLMPSHLEPFIVPVALVAVGCYLLIDQG